ncbi:hypothetical protein M0R45_026894 [Rubus argutus]|uniref:Uncharacterized protein n=1 Tax=Rubus argutus TaxID=59490 RepID=A0AAW1WYR8_RUBAR
MSTLSEAPSSAAIVLAPICNGVVALAMKQILLCLRSSLCVTGSSMADSISPTAATNALFSISRGAIEDLIMRLHKLLCNRSTTAFIFNENFCFLYYLSSLWIDFVSGDSLLASADDLSLQGDFQGKQTVKSRSNHWNTVIRRKTIKGKKQCHSENNKQNNKPEDGASI